MRLRRGMWAMYKGKVGIVNSFNDVAVEFHMVDEKGNTTEVVLVDPGLVSQAPYKEIPESRRPEKLRAKQFGYA